MSLIARMELLVVSPIFVLPVMVIASAAPDPLSINVQHAPRIVLFSKRVVAYGCVTRVSTSTLVHHHARIAILVAQAALVLALMNVWHVQTLKHF